METIRVTATYRAFTFCVELIEFMLSFLMTTQIKINGTVIKQGPSGQFQFKPIADLVLS